MNRNQMTVAGLVALLNSPVNEATLETVQPVLHDILDAASGFFDSPTDSAIAVAMYAIGGINEASAKEILSRVEGLTDDMADMGALSPTTRHLCEEVCDLIGPEFNADGDAGDGTELSDGASADDGGSGDGGGAGNGADVGAGAGHAGDVEMFGSPPGDLNFPPCGIIFEFKELTRAEAFARAVKKQFGLGGRVFDDEAAAAASHLYPFVQRPPVVHIDRPWWNIDPKTSPKEWDEAWKIELEIDDMAAKFGGTFLGT